jgi:hypothetical protein
MNSYVEEMRWLESILYELQHYPDHNDRALDQIRSIVSYRIWSEEQSIIARYNSTHERDE